MQRVFLWYHVRVSNLTEDEHVDAKEVYGILLRAAVIDPWSGDPPGRFHLSPFHTCTYFGADVEAHIKPIFTLCDAVPSMQPKSACWGRAHPSHTNADWTW